MPDSVTSRANFALRTSDFVPGMAIRCFRFHVSRQRMAAQFGVHPGLWLELPISDKRRPNLPADGEPGRSPVRWVADAAAFFLFQAGKAATPPGCGAGPRPSFPGRYIEGYGAEWPGDFFAETSGLRNGQTKRP